MNGAKKTLRKRPLNSLQTNLANNPMSLNLNAPPPAPAYNFPAPQARYLPTSTRAQIVTVLLVTGAVLSFASSIVALIELATPGELFTDEGMENPLMIVFALLVMGLAALTVVVYIATVVVFLMWLYRAHQNLQAFGIRKNQMQYSSGWAVGSFFIPFASLVIPYRAIKELWRKSMPGASSMFGEISPPSFFPIWWGFWIVSNIMDQLYFRLSLRAESPSEVVEPIGVISGLLGMIAAFFAIKVVRDRTAASRKPAPESRHHFIRIAAGAANLRTGNRNIADPRLQSMKKVSPFRPAP